MVKRVKLVVKRVMPAFEPVVKGSVLVGMVAAVRCDGWASQLICHVAWRGTCRFVALRRALRGRLVRRAAARVRHAA